MRMFVCKYVCILMCVCTYVVCSYVRMYVCTHVVFSHFFGARPQSQRHSGQDRRLEQQPRGPRREPGFRKDTAGDLSRLKFTFGM